MIVTTFSNSFWVKCECWKSNLWTNSFSDSVYLLMLNLHLKFGFLSNVATCSIVSLSCMFSFSLISFLFSYVKWYNAVNKSRELVWYIFSFCFLNVMFWYIKPIKPSFVVILCWFFLTKNMSMKCSVSVVRSFISVNDRLWYLLIGSK